MHILIKAVGVKALATQFNELPTTVNATLARRLEKYAKDPIMEESVRRCPKDTGALRSTNKVRRLKLGTGPSRAAVELSYGGPTPGSSEHFVEGAKIKPYVDYAWLLHERTYRSYSEPGTGPKYLEQPIMDHMMSLERIVRSGVQEATLSVFRRSFFHTLKY